MHAEWIAWIAWIRDRTINSKKEGEEEESTLVTRHVTLNLLPTAPHHFCSFSPAYIALRYTPALHSPLMDCIAADVPTAPARVGRSAEAIRCAAPIALPALPRPLVPPDPPPPGGRNLRWESKCAAPAEPRIDALSAAIPVPTGRTGLCAAPPSRLLRFRSLCFYL